MFERGANESWLAGCPANDNNFKIHLNDATPAELARVYACLPDEGNKTKKAIILKEIAKKVKPQRIRMIADFKLLERKDHIPDIFKHLTKDDLDNMFVGGYVFTINKATIPFDWDAHSCSEKNGVFHLETGYGPFANDFRIPEYWDEEYAEMGLTRDDITAKFLASATEIIDFYVSFDTDSDLDEGIGNNKDSDATRRIKLLSVSFEDRESGEVHKVDKAVIEAFNGMLSASQEYPNERVNIEDIPEGADAVFLPGKLHGCKDELYIIWYNPNACDGAGSWDIAPVDWETVLELYEDVEGNEDDFFALLPDRFQGMWYYCDGNSDGIDSYTQLYNQADFLRGRDGGEREEMEFIINWAKARKEAY